MNIVASEHLPPPLQGVPARGSRVGARWSVWNLPTQTIPWRIQLVCWEIWIFKTWAGAVQGQEHPEGCWFHLNFRCLTWTTSVSHPLECVVSWLGLGWVFGKRSSPRVWLSTKQVPQGIGDSTEPHRDHELFAQHSQACGIVVGPGVGLGGFCGSFPALDILWSSDPAAPLRCHRAEGWDHLQSVSVAGFWRGQNQSQITG